MYSYLKCKVGDNLYGFDLKSVREIGKIAQMVCEAEMPKDMLGLLRWREEIVPVIDMRRRFDLRCPSCGKNDEMVILDGIEGRRIGVVVDAILDAVDHDGDIIPLPSLEPPVNQMLKGVIVVEASMVGIVDGGKIVRCPERVAALVAANLPGEQHPDLDFYRLNMPGATAADRETLRLRASGYGDAVEMEEVGEDRNTIFVVKVGNGVWAIKIEDVLEFVLFRDKYKRVGFLTPPLVGHVSVRSEALPLVDFNPFEDGEKNIGIVLKLGEEKIVFLASEIERVLRVDGTGVRLEPATGTYHKFQLVAGSIVVPIVDVAKLVWEHGEVILSPGSNTTKGENAHV